MYVTSIEIRSYKFIANFNRPQMADQFIEFLKTKLGNDPQFIGYKQRIKNSVVYVCHDGKTGHALAKEFEDAIIANELSKINEAQSAQPEPVHPIVENQVMVEEVVEQSAEETIQQEHQEPAEDTAEEVVESETSLPENVDQNEPAKENTVNKIFSIFKSNNQ
jgi:hypothetical protein